MLAEGKMLKTWRVIVVLVALTLALVWGVREPVNSPYGPEAMRENALYTAFTNRSPNNLDPALSYSTDETPFTYSIYEPLYAYHYLMRPYELIPKTAEAISEPVYEDEHGNILAASAPGEQVHKSVYTIKIKPNILYQPHPAFAKDEQGNYRYYPIREQDLKGAYSLSDFAYQGTRELSAHDYEYGFKRLASPRLASPISSVMAAHILGFEQFANDLLEKNKLDPKSAWLDLRQSNLEGVQAIDEHTLQISVIGKYPQFKYWLAMTFAAPVPWEAERFFSQQGMAEHNLSLNSWPVGTGPFMLTESITNRRHVLERNPNYRGEPYPCEGEPGDKQAGLLRDCGLPMPFLDKVVFSIEKESVPLMGKFLQGYYDIPQVERGEYGVAMTVAAGDSTDKAQMYAQRGLQLRTQAESGLFYLGFNWLDPVVGQGDNPEQAERNRKLRMALSIVFDWEQYVSIFMNGQALVSHSPVPPGVLGYQPLPEGANPYVYEQVDQQIQRRSLEEARQLLAQAGYPDGRDATTGKPLILYFDSMTGMGADASMDWMRRQLGQLGVQLEVRATDYNRFQEKMKKGGAQLFIWGWNADYPDAENFLYLLYGPQAKAVYGGENASNYHNPEYDRLFEKMRFLDDGPEKEAVIHRMVDLVRHDAAWMWGYIPNSGGAYQSWVGNAKPTQMVRDSLQYLRVQSDLRSTLTAQWNKPNWWPMALLFLAIWALVAMVTVLARRRSQTRALQAQGRQP